MPPISEKNIELIDSKKKEFGELSEYFLKDGLQRHIQSIYQYRAIQKDIVTLAVLIAGIVIPILNTNEKSSFFIVAIACFILHIVIGVVRLGIISSRDIRDIPNTVKKQVDRAVKFMQDLESLKQIENNKEAGEKYYSILAEASLTPEEDEVKRIKFFVSFDAIFFGLFLTGLVLMFIGIIITNK